MTGKCMKIEKGTSVQQMSSQEASKLLIDANCAGESYNDNS